MAKTHAPSLPKAVDDCHQLLVWIIPCLDQFPRNRRFTLGERIETRLLSVLEQLVDAAYGVRRRAALEKANRELEVVRHWWQICAVGLVITVNIPQCFLQ